MLTLVDWDDDGDALIDGELVTAAEGLGEGSTLLDGLGDAATDGDASGLRYDVGETDDVHDVDAATDGELVMEGVIDTVAGWVAEMLADAVTDMVIDGVAVVVLVTDVVMERVAVADAERLAVSETDGEADGDGDTDGQTDNGGWLLMSSLSPMLNCAVPRRPESALPQHLAVRFEYEKIAQVWSEPAANDTTGPPTLT